ncbi:hypothetical protein EVAR_92191_1 [Eumeta japonica]|uniref:Uncharacterized protein n=1 Tax=Eumeta variegata TaxID=151549 RepID=A0A4C1SBT1_EUMVA|nr:hypothetical protein EVAR_92191_1 [Eumeta japonica]
MLAMITDVVLRDKALVRVGWCYFMKDTLVAWSTFDRELCLPKPCVIGDSNTSLHTPFPGTTRRCTGCSALGKNKMCLFMRQWVKGGSPCVSAAESQIGDSIESAAQTDPRSFRKGLAFLGPAPAVGRGGRALDSDLICFDISGSKFSF